MLDSCLLEQRRANFAAWPLKSSTSQLLLLLALVKDHLHHCGRTSNLSLSLSCFLFLIRCFHICFVDLAKIFRHALALFLALLLIVQLFLFTSISTENMSAVRLILHRLVISISVSWVFARSEEPRNEVDGQTNHTARVHILSAPFAKIDKSNQAVMWTTPAVAAQHLVCNNWPMKFPVV
ncbi:hypothetical protein T10_13507 [Trichinella papuae]|uniref:Uncharacterized protein n=1 Tax=Trichinella papuae TaxID=268474 RepID=A0A0V1MGT8_9BILA|nr:hypothetical protein T10_13507 [Trichinella papuae]